MDGLIIVGRKSIPREHVALVEAFDREASPRLQTERDFRARVVLVSRDSVLTEATPEAFAKSYGFRLLAEENVATNPVVHFRVESFAAADGFEPRKPYRTRLLWRDLDGNDQSKLLLTAPEAVLSVVVKGEAQTAAAPAPNARRSRRRAPAPAPEA